MVWLVLVPSNVSESESRALLSFRRVVAVGLSIFKVMIDEIERHKSMT